MVYTRATASVQREALHAAFRQYNISAALTPKFEASITDLEVVDTSSSSVRCQGSCANGGRCTQKIDQHNVARSVLQLQIIALDAQVVDDELHERLGDVYENLLCGSAGHCTDAQVVQCADRAYGIVLEWREQWLSVPTAKAEEPEDCKRCAQLEIDLDDAQATVAEHLRTANKRADGLKKREGELSTLRRHFDDLTVDRDDAVDRAARAEDRAEELAQQLQTLQLQHDGFLGRISSDIQQQKEQSSRASTPAFSRGASVFSSPTFEFKSSGGAKKVDQQTGKYDWKALKTNEGRAGAATPATTPSSSIFSPTSSSQRTNGNEGPFAHLRQHGTFEKPTAHKADYPTTPSTASSRPFAKLSTPGSKPGMIGIGNTLKAGQRQDRKHFQQPSGIFTPEQTPQKKEDPDRSVLFKAGLAHSDGLASGSQQDERACGAEPTRFRSQTDDILEALAAGNPSINPWAVPEVKEKAPFGFAVKKRE